MGSTVAEVSGTLGAEQPGYEIDKLDFYFKLLPDPSGEGLDGDPALVYCRRHETARVVRPVTGECKLLEAPLDPIADFPVRRVRSFEYAEISSSQGGRDRRAGAGRVAGAVHAPALRRPERAGGQAMSDVPATGSDRYIVVSADGHAGLACEDYRPYLEAKYHPAFEEYLAERTAHREESLRSTTTTSWGGRRTTRRA